MNALVDPDGARDPSQFGWPVTLPLEVALRTAPIKSICEAYGLSQAEWETLRLDPNFQAEVRAAAQELKKEGMSFKVKARLQAEELLKTSWQLIHAPWDGDLVVPANVRADLIKFTVRAAGLDGSKDQAANSNTNQNAFSINIYTGP